MKKMVLSLAITALMASPALAGIAGSKHDLSDDFSVNSGRICVYCHTPHFSEDPTAGQSLDDYKPLWNRAKPKGEYSTMYASQTTQLQPGKGNRWLAHRPLKALPELP